MYVVDKVNDALNEESKAVRGANVVVLESPALDVIGLLEKCGANVAFHDPYVAKMQLENDAIMERTSYLDALLENADCVVIVTDHTAYDWQHVLDHSKLIVDTRHATTPH